ncbi:MAG TPA: hydroxymyristoyl-ACP dehydratase [Methylococcus sp.]|nr:hydroxymyristoyl-ACP dehydratase [Methylococcus sp.]
MSFDRRWIAERIPHQGDMCLLDRVIAWDPGRVLCLAKSHRSADHPLRSRGCLSILCGIEYAGQAMAVHGALLASVAGRPAAWGVLAGLRDVRFWRQRLDLVAGDLFVEVERIAWNESDALYRFRIRAEAEGSLLDGRAVVRLNADRGRVLP